MSDTSALTLYEAARELIDSGQRTAGIEKLRQAVLLAPHFKTYEVLGEALLAEGLPAEACVYLAAAAGLGRRQFRSRYLLAQALLALGEDHAFDAAMQLREALALNPQYRSAKDLFDRMLAARPALADQIEEQE